MDTSDWPLEDERRSETRRHLLFATTARGEDGDSQPVLVRDISESGLLLETEEGALLDRSITVLLPEAGEVAAQVIWQGDKLAGCRLQGHLSQVAIDAVRAKGEAAHAEQVASDTPMPRTAARTLAARLKQLRMERDLTRAELAERSGISTPSIWAWETGRTVPRLGSLETLAKGLGVAVSELQIGSAEGLASGDASGSNGYAESGAELADTVANARAQIAALAGVTPDRVSITITL